MLVLPTVQRHRFFRIKQRLPGAAARAAQLAATAFACALATAAGLGTLRGGSPGSGGPWWRAAAAHALGSLLAGTLCTFGWLAGAAVLEVVLTEQLRPGGYSERDELAALTACLKGSRGPIMRDLALQDLCHLATADTPAAAARRGEVWADDTGDRWRPLGQACLAEVQVSEHGLDCLLLYALITHPPHAL